ncbi:MAG: DUF3801 domain-containing protein [Clostridia bacterium]|nr:DUF3801 domain-containing protein [Clostridia bacterium]
MNTGGESAELLMKMMLNGSEVLIRLTGSGAKNVAVLLYSVLREQNKTKGSERLSNMLRSGKKLRVYTFQEKDLPKFKEVAKQYGILYTVLKEKDHTGGVFDVLVRAEDEHKLARVIERFEFSHVDTASLRAEIIREKEERAAAQKKESAETKEEPQEKATEEKEKTPEEASAQSAEDKAADELMAGAKKREEAKVNPSEARSDESMQFKEESKGLEQETASRDIPKTPDTQTQTDREFLSEPLSETPKEKSESHRNYHSKQKPSVRKKIEQMKRERAKASQNVPVPTRSPKLKER